MIFKPKVIAFILSLFYLINSYAALTQEEAEKRAKQFSDIDYVLGFNFTQAEYNSDTDNTPNADNALYSGRVHISFQVTSHSSILDDEFFLDFRSLPHGAVKNVLINGQSSTVRWDKKEGKLYLASKMLNPGTQNTVDLTFINSFTHQGQGLHRAVDETDREVYLYTNFEPYDANELFPLFDQPNLKARYTVNVEVPNKWEVISNTRETAIQQTSIDTKTWFFPQSQKFSTYLFMLAAGPFTVWESNKGHIPSRLFARKSIETQVVPQEWFDATATAFEFYESKFGAYPFKKYDQVLVPDFAAGAMENVAAVTFAEKSYANNQNLSLASRTNLVKVIAHEMAHMWFGDLVTMKWWDDLWLNESFATFCATYFSEKYKSELNLVENPWQGFFDRYKTWGYTEDNYQTSHPIVSNVVNTDAANSVFDGITYGKGASLLRQLAYYIGEDTFFDGVKQYLDKFHFQNATREDFINTLSDVSGIDLSEWDETWLGNQGTDRVKVTFSASNGKISSLVLHPLPADPLQKPRTHKTQIGLYGYDDNGHIVLKETFPVIYSGESVEISEAIGKEEPVFVFANTHDYDFSLPVVNLTDFQKIDKVFGQISDEFVQLQLFYSFWSMVEHADLPARNLIDLVLKTDIADADSYVLSSFRKYLQKSLKYAPLDERAVLNHKISSRLYSKALAADAGSPLQSSLFSWFLSFPPSENMVSVIVNLLSGHTSISGLNVSNWSLITALAKANYSGVQQIIDEAAASNPNSYDALLAQVSIANVQNKKKWFNKLTEFGQYMTINTRFVVDINFHDAVDDSLTAFVEDEYLDVFLNLSKQNESNKKLTYLAGLYPINTSEGFDQHAREFLEQHKDEIPFDARRKILENIENSERMHRARLL